MKFMKKSLCVVLFAASAFAFADTATVVSAVGKVEVSRNNVWVALSKDAVIKEGEIISTGFKSEALIKYKDSVMKLGPMTRVTLEKMKSNETADNVSVYLSTGTVRSSVSHAENKRVSYTVRNPIAVASVRGTGFDFDGTGYIDCSEGGILVMSSAYYDQQVSNAENSTNLVVPADGKSNAFTDTSDINPQLKGGVLLTGGQCIEMTPDISNVPSRSSSVAEKSINDVVNTVNSISDTEGIVTGTITAPSNGSVSGGKGSLIVKVNIKDAE